MNKHASAIFARASIGPGAKSRPTVTAHAGSLGTEPNGEASFAAALEFPVDFLEADIRFTRDGRAYLSHDALPPAEAERAMGLEELLAMVAPRPGIRLNLDLKEHSAVGALRDLVISRGMGSRVVLTGVRLGEVPGVRAAAAGLPYFLNAEPRLLARATRAGAESFARRVRGCGAVGLNTHKAFATSVLAGALARAGLELSVWTVDEEAEMRAILALGPDNVTTRRPDRLLALLDSGREGTA